MPDTNGNPYYQVVRTRISDGGFPNQVVEFELTESERAANAVREIWSRLPNVRAGKEVVRIVTR